MNRLTVTHVRKLAREMADQRIKEALAQWMQAFLHPNVPILILPGGGMPKLMTDGAIGFDVRLRRVVDAFEMDERTPYLRKTLYDFSSILDSSVVDLIERREVKEFKRPRMVYRLDPGEKVLCSAGFVVEMPYPLCYLTMCRSGIASRYHIGIVNSPGTIDPDYRGEAGLSLENRGRRPFYLYQGMRIAQIKFEWAVIPRFKLLRSYRQFSKTARGGKGFGSTLFR